MSKAKLCDPSQQVRIQRINNGLHSDIAGIALKKGVPATNFVKPIISEFIKSFPEELLSANLPCEKCFEIRVQGIGRKNKEKLMAIAKYAGVGESDLSKVIVLLDSLTVPAHMKTLMVK